MFGRPSCIAVCIWNRDDVYLSWTGWSCSITRLWERRNGNSSCSWNSGCCCCCCCTSGRFSSKSRTDICDNNKNRNTFCWISNTNCCCCCCCATVVCNSKGGSCNFVAVGGVEWEVGGGEGGGCGLGVLVAGVGRLVNVSGRSRCIGGGDGGGKDKIENGIGNPT